MTTSPPRGAAGLVVSRETVEWHLGSVYRKLDIPRAQDLTAAMDGPGFLTQRPLLGSRS